MISVRKMEILDDEEETPMMVDMECWEDELSPEQKATYKQLEKEHKIVKNELDKIVGMDSCKMVFNGLQFKIIEVDGPISKLPSGSRERRKPPTPPPTYRRDSRYRDGTLKKRVRFVVGSVSFKRITFFRIQGRDQEGRFSRQARPGLRTKKPDLRD